MRLSIRTRMTLWYCLVFSLSVCLLQAAVYVRLQATMTNSVDKDLTTRMTGLADFLREHLGRLPLTRVLSDLQIHIALQPTLTILQDQQGHTLYCGTQAQALCGTPIPAGTQGLAAAPRLRLQTSTYTIRGVPYRLMVASDLSQQRQLLAHFRNLVLLILPAALLCAGLGGYWISGRSFAPVAEMIASVRSINDRSLSLRLRVPPTGDEIQLLSETLNGMLARVEASFRQVTELTANASHELRTPLAIIRTASDVALLNSRPTVTSHRDALLQIRTAAEKNTSLLESLLLLARADAGVQPLNLAPIDLPASVARSVAACQVQANARAIHLSLHDRTQPPAARPSAARTHADLWADPTLLHRLWILLIDNAIKYTPPGGSVRVSLDRTATGQAVCEIADTGIGISAADLPRIYDRFFRAEAARLHSDAGSGLGLTMVKWITEALHAELAVTSEPGLGTRFQVSFSTESPHLANRVATPAVV